MVTQLVPLGSLTWRATLAVLAMAAFGCSKDEGSEVPPDRQPTATNTQIPTPKVVTPSPAPPAPTEELGERVEPNEPPAKTPPSAPEAVPTEEAKPVAPDPAVQAKVLAELKPHIANCKKAAWAVKSTILRLRKAAEAGDMATVRRLNNQLGDLGTKVAAAESGGVRVLDAYREKGIDVEAAREAFLATCSTDVEE
ncbi:MAG: hypothetical protein AMXMBFR64_28320 [Myxococcales bacterium]